MNDDATRRQPRLVRDGLVIGDTCVPLLAGSVHYYQLERDVWSRALAAVAALGARFVDTYVPWGVHEVEKGNYDFGARHPYLDLGEFLREAERNQLWVIARPGPHINGELTYFGLPERVIWTDACQARSARGRPVALPAPPLAFPVPSYASQVFIDEAAEWLRAVGSVLANHLYPRGPVVLVQLDNEGALYFRDGVYDQDYHVDAIAAFRQFVGERYSTEAELRAAYGDPAATFATLEPPRQLSASTASELGRHLDWAEFQETLLPTALARFRHELASSGLSECLTLHNLPMAEAKTPLDPVRVGQQVDLLALDVYHAAGEQQHAAMARRVSEMDLRSDLRGHPTYAAEIGAGFPYFFAPLAPQDNEFAALAALAYGLTGFNIYMAVDRDRWIGAPIDQHGRPRPTADFWAKLIEMSGRLELSKLRRRVEAFIVVPRHFRRLGRVMHAFGPVSPAALDIAGLDAGDTCFEDTLGLPGPVVMEADSFAKVVEEKLSARKIPFAWADEQLFERCVGRGGWTILVCPGALSKPLLDSAIDALRAGKHVSLGPHFPERDDRMSPRQDLPSLPSRMSVAVPALLGLNAPAIGSAVEAMVSAEVLHPLPFTSGVRSVALSVLEDGVGRARVVFALNPGAAPARVQVDVGQMGADEAVDALSQERFVAGEGTISLPLAPTSVRMLELRGGK